MKLLRINTLAAGFLTLFLLSCNNDVMASPWKFTEPGDLENDEDVEERDAEEESDKAAPSRGYQWGCAELEDWEADDQFESTRRYYDDHARVTRSYYQARLPLAVEDCGVFAVSATLFHTAHDDESRGGFAVMDTEVQVCNRCDEDAELLWIGSSNGLVDLQVLGNLGPMPDLVVDVESLDHTNEDLITADKFDITRKRLGPVVFVQPPGQEVVSTLACHRGTFVFPNKALITRHIMAPGERAQYSPESSSLPYRNNDRVRVCDETQCPKLIQSSSKELKAGEVRFTIAWPRLRPVQAEIEWESATFLHDSVCLEAGFSLPYGGPGGSSGWPLHQEEKPAQVHWKNHFIQKFTLGLPPELVEIIQGGVSAQEDDQ